MRKSSFTSPANRSIEDVDMVDMSLDDIIRLKRKQKSNQAQKTNSRLPINGHYTQGKKTGPRTGLTHINGGVNKRFGQNRRLPPMLARRRGQGVITGLAAKKFATRFKGVSPLNRPPQYQPLLNRPAQTQPMFNQQTPSNASLNQKTQPFFQRRQMPFQKRPGRLMHSQGLFSHRPFTLQRKWFGQSVQQAHREARQATFLSRRGLKVHAQVQKTPPGSHPPTQRARMWRPTTDNAGLLTVSIDNPTARTQPEPVQSWSLHSSSSSSSVKVEAERKPPKGVALEFDINSVAKQTAMTLNERFGILKEQCVSAAHQSTKAKRLVTVA